MRTVMQKRCVCCSQVDPYCCTDDTRKTSEHNLSTRFVLNASGPATTKPKSPRWPWELHRLVWLCDKLYNAAAKTLPCAHNLFHIVSRHQQKNIFSKDWQLVQPFAGPWRQWSHWSHGYQIIERHFSHNNCNHQTLCNTRLRPPLKKKTDKIKKNLCLYLWKLLFLIAAKTTQTALQATCCACFYRWQIKQIRSRPLPLQIEQDD